MVQMINSFIACCVTQMTHHSNSTFLTLIEKEEIQIACSGHTFTKMQLVLTTSSTALAKKTPLSIEKVSKMLLKVQVFKHGSLVRITFNAQKLHFRKKARVNTIEISKECPGLKTHRFILSSRTCYMNITKHWT